MAEAASVTDRVERERFWPLPHPLRADGRPRRTGVEIEFAGVDEPHAAALVAALWGGRPETAGALSLTVTGTRLGDVTVERDTALANSGAEGLVLSMLGELVPVEIVTPPLDPDALPEADRLVDALRAAGARGTRDSIGFGFGVHLNPEVAAKSAEFVLPVVRAYGLMEDWLRTADPLDPARRLLPFVDPWPRALVDALAADGAGWDLAALATAYLQHSPRRNRGLDLLPLLEHVTPGAVQAALPAGQAKGGRPAFHYRLPEARVDEADWSVAYEWNRWVLIERVAARPALLAALAEGWRAHRSGLISRRGDWAREVEARLAEARIWQG